MSAGEHLAEPLRRTASAKLNLFLHVTGRRPDGYHLLESLFAFTENGDTVAVQPASKLVFEVDGPFAKSLNASSGADNNLVIKAARALLSNSGKTLGAHIRLTKNLPIAAGVGGGSADAAATLLVLNDLWQLNLSLAELGKIGLALGADVPACLHRGPLQVTGVGERIEQTKLPSSYGVLLVNPGVEVSTPAVFEAFHSASTAYQSSLEAWPRVDETIFLNWVRRETTNCLEGPATMLCPAITKVLHVLRSLDDTLLVRMSGSGGTCFALFESAEKAHSAKCDLEKSHPGWWLFSDRLLAG